jgi:hypothetical protein
MKLLMDRFQATLFHMRGDLRGRNIRVPQKFLNDPQISAVGQKGAWQKSVDYVLRDIVATHSRQQFAIVYCHFGPDLRFDYSDQGTRSSVLIDRGKNRVFPASARFGDKRFKQGTFPRHGKPPLFHASY